MCRYRTPETRLIGAIRGPPLPTWQDLPCFRSMTTTRRSCFPSSRSCSSGSVWRRGGTCRGRASRSRRSPSRSVGWGPFPPRCRAGSRRAAPARGRAAWGLTWQALFSSMFLHASWMHLIGNMWFLWIFGNNVEDSMGHLRFLVFYVLAGLVAAMAHVLSDPSSTLPMVGASGAISAVMGAYLVLYPRALVHTLFFFIVFFRIIPLPAWVLVGYWIVIQVVSSLLEPSGGRRGVHGAHRWISGRSRSDLRLPQSEAGRGQAEWCRPFPGRALPSRLVVSRRAQDIRRARPSPSHPPLR